MVDALTASIALCVKWENATETFALRTCRSQWMRNGSKMQLMCIFRFLLILTALCLLPANLPGCCFRWMQEGRLNCCKELNISAVCGAGDVRGVWCWQGILRMTLWKDPYTLRSISLSFQFLMRSAFIHLGRERKAFSPVASLSGKLGKPCVISQKATSASAQTSWPREFAQKHPQIPACFCCFHSQDKDIRLWERQPCAFTLGAVPGENYSPGFPSKAAALYFWA